MLELRPPRVFLLQGTDIFLRPLVVSDVGEHYVRWMNDPQITRYLESRFKAYTLEEIQGYVRDLSQDTDNILAGIFLNATEQHIGNIKLGPLNRHHGFAEMGLIIGAKEHWGRGYAAQAIRLFSDFGFDQVGLNRIVAGAYESNQGSVKAFLKSGFQKEGVLRGHWLVDGVYQDGICLGKRRCEKAN